MGKAGEGGGFKDWKELRTHTIHTFNETPHPITEQEIIAAYETHPTEITKAIDSIAAAVKNGTIRSGWAVLRTRATAIKAPPSNPTRPASLEREKKTARAEQWIRAAGLHYDSQTELIDELFGDRGQLREHPDLKTHMLELYATVRPEGEAIEAEAIERAEKWKAQQAELEPVDLPF